MSRREDRVRRRRAIQRTEREQTSTPVPHPLQWGQGQVTRADLAMAKAALVNGYPIDDHMREDVVAAAWHIMQTSAHERNRLAAAKVLLTADALNLGRERLASEERRPGAVVNVFDRAQVLLQQLAAPPTDTPAQPQIAQDAATAADPQASLATCLCP